MNTVKGRELKEDKMPSKKHQHYVSVFYLKFFSHNNEGRQISVYNIKSEKYISKASLRDQAYEDYFYGSDGVMESGFEILENRVSKLLHQMIEENSHPKYYSKDHHAILTFTILLHARTLRTAEELNEMVDKLLKKILSKDPRVKDRLNEVKIGYAKPAKVIVQVVVSMLPIVMDLAFKILVNKTKTPFITSDHPVVFYNQFFESMKHWGSNIGLASKGLQIFFPISPLHLLMFYDKKLYKVGGKRHKPINISNTKDVDNLNGLQNLNARANLYFNESVSESYIRTLNTQISKYLTTSRVRVKEYPDEIQKTKLHRSLVHTYKKDIRCNFSLSFVKQTKHAKEFQIDNRAVYIRNEALDMINWEFTTLVDQGKYRPSEFKRFLNDKRNAKK